MFFYFEARGKIALQITALQRVNELLEFLMGILHNTLKFQ